MRDRHTLGECTYTALLEMSLVADERKVPWSRQTHAIKIASEGTIGSAASGGRSGEIVTAKGNGSQEGALTKMSVGQVSRRELQVQGPGNENYHDMVIDDTLKINNMEPVALIFKHLSDMHASVQVWPLSWGATAGNWAGRGGRKGGKDPCDCSSGQ